jgi:1-acyl-sn-glycerol-3-phosphate acyltransferase
MAALRVRVKGREKIPLNGGAMMLANHAAFMDVLTCFWAVDRPTSGIGSEQVFRLPVVGSILKLLGGVPYSKGAKDGKAVRALVAAYEEGAIIGMFPEGFRSWTGKPLPIRRGTGRLVKSIGCPVVYCKVYTGFLQHPRWATYPRLIPWHMEYFYEEFSPEATADEINEAIARGIAIDPDKVELPKHSWGYRLADGLEEFLWACPGCFEVESLRIDPKGNHIGCPQCARRWRVDLRCFMVAESPDTESLSIAAARDRLTEHFSLKTEVTCDALEVTMVQRGQLKREHVALGAARLGTDAIEVYEGDTVVWSLPYDEMTAVLLQFRNALQVRANGNNYELTPDDQSRLRWHHFLAMRCQGMVG